MSTETVTASDGTQLPLSSLETVCSNDGTHITSMYVDYPNRSDGTLTRYTQTFTYSGNIVTNISQWIAGPIP